MSSPALKPQDAAWRETRKQRVWDLHDLSTGRGLEIGPMHRTLADGDRADVKYVDVFDTERLRDHYRQGEAVQEDLIPEVDFPLFDGTRTRTIPEAVEGSGPFDWVIASHVIEHVPDVIGWLDQIAQVTVDDGALILVLPDRRYSFDVLRQQTSVGQMIHAHDLKDQVPSVRAVYDHFRSHSNVRVQAAWDGAVPSVDERSYSLDVVKDRLARARAGEYVDSHVWTFTPDVFIEQLVELRTLDLSCWRIAKVVPTLRDEPEFYAVLRRLPRAQPWDDALFADEPQAVEDVPDVSDEVAGWRRQAQQQARQIRRLTKKVVTQEARIGLLRARVKRLESQLADVEGSWRWRLGGVVTTPLRKLAVLNREPGPGRARRPR